MEQSDLAVFAGCCACAASGQAIAVSPTGGMNSRRCYWFPSSDKVQAHAFSSGGAVWRIERASGGQIRREATLVSDLGHWELSDHALRAGWPTRLACANRTLADQSKARAGSRPYVAAQQSLPQTGVLLMATQRNIVAIVDDDPVMREALEALLSRL